MKMRIEKKIVAVRLDMKLFEKVKERAKKENRSIPNQIMIIVKQYFGDYVPWK